MISYAKVDILKGYIFPQHHKNTSEFLLAPFPLNLIYTLMAEKQIAA